MTPLRVVERLDGGKWLPVPVLATRDKAEAYFYSQKMRYPVRIVEGDRVVWSMRRRRDAAIIGG